MSTVPVITATAVPAKESGLQKFENILTGIADGLQKTENAIVNVTGAEASVITALLPPSLSTPILAAQKIAASTFAAMVAQEQAIGASTVPYAQKVATIVALQGAELAKILAGAGLESGQSAIQTIVETATGISTIGKITGTPVSPTAVNTGA